MTAGYIIETIINDTKNVSSEKILNVVIKMGDWLIFEQNKDG